MPSRFPPTYDRLSDLRPHRIKASGTPTSPQITLCCRLLQRSSELLRPVCLAPAPSAAKFGAWYLHSLSSYPRKWRSPTHAASRAAVGVLPGLPAGRRLPASFLESRCAQPSGITGRQGREGRPHLLPDTDG